MNTLISRLLGSAALAIALGLAPASAQTPDSGGGTNLQGGAQGGVQAPGSAQGQGGAQGGVQAPGSAQGQGGAQGGVQAPGSAQGQGGATIQGQGEGRAQGQGGATIQGQGEGRAQGEGQVQGQDKGQAQGQGKTQGQTEGEASGGMETKQDSEKGSRAQKQRQGTEDGDRGQARSGTGGDSSGAKTEITSKQKTEIKQYFSKNKVNARPVEVSRVNVSVGIAVPTFVTLYSLPSAIVIDARSDCPYQYFVWGNDIVIVESCNRTVVDIIVGAA